MDREWCRGRLPVSQPALALRAHPWRGDRKRRLPPGQPHRRRSGLPSDHPRDDQPRHYRRGATLPLQYRDQRHHGAGECAARLRARLARRRGPGRARRAHPRGGGGDPAAHRSGGAPFRRGALAGTGKPEESLHRSVARRRPIGPREGAGDGGGPGGWQGAQPAHRRRLGARGGSPGAGARRGQGPALVGRAGGGQGRGRSRTPREYRDPGMSRIKLAGVLLAGVLLAWMSGGCGYTLQGNLPGDLKTVSVPVFKNRTTEAGAESTITSAVVNAFTTNGRLRVVALDKADSVLEGEIIG